MHRGLEGLNSHTATRHPCFIPPTWMPFTTDLRESRRAPGANRLDDGSNRGPDAVGSRGARTSGPCISLTRGGTIRYDVVVKLALLALATVAVVSCSKPDAQQPPSSGPVSAEPLAPAEAERRALARHVADAVRNGPKPRDPASEPGRAGLIGLLQTGAGGDPDAPTAPWGSDDTGPGSARGNAWGDPPGSSAEPDKDGSDKGMPHVRAGEPIVSGRLPPAVIMRIVRQRFGRVRVCYADALKIDPKLQGTVTVEFTIKEDGSVAGLSAGGSLPNKDVITCVKKSFADCTFPQPEGGTAKVSYPIALSPPDKP